MDLVFKFYVVTIRNFNTHVDLIILVMVDFDVILGMEWLSHYHAIMDYFSKTVTLRIPDVPLVML